MEGFWISFGAVAAVGLAVVLCSHTARHWSGSSDQWSLSSISTDSIGNALFQAHDVDALRFALPMAFSRFAVPAPCACETLRTRVMFGVLLGGVALCNLNLRASGQLDGFGLLLGTQLATYVGMLSIWRTNMLSLGAACACGGLVAVLCDNARVVFACRFLFGTPLIIQVSLGMAICWLSLAAMSSHVSHWPRSHVHGMSAVCAVVGALLVPLLVAELVRFFLPVHEIVTVYKAVSGFTGASALNGACLEMILLTANIQVPLGYLGIAYLRYAQERQNRLLKVGPAVDRDPTQISAPQYVAHVRHWVIAICFPFVLQRTVMTSIHSYAFGRFRHWTERSLRLHSVFPEDGTTGTLLKAVAISNFTVEAYADAINGVVEMSFAIVSAKLSALPKLLLVPGVLATKPWLLCAVLPASVTLDIGKAYLSAALTVRIEALHRELMELASRRRRMELHDMRHEELIQRGRAAAFAKSRWREVGTQIEDRGMRLGAIQNLRSFIDMIYNQQILGPGIDCALAFLMEVGYVATSEIGLYTTVLEQAIDTLLTRHREQATLANMHTKVGLVDDLARHLAHVRSSARPKCEFIADASSVHVSSLEYARGQTHVRISELDLRLGRMYAVTGGNGCGKSTALSILTCCGKQGAIFPSGAELVDASATITLPSDDVVEIAQQFYCPLFATPMSWLLQQEERIGPNVHGNTGRSDIEAQAVALLKEFGLLRTSSFTGDDSQPRGLSESELHLEKEDWYSELSGGERCKIEFIRKVFLRPRCPAVLLIDEAFAPLDPASKQAVQFKLKEFCNESLVLAVYHGGEAHDCLNGEGFFDDNLHFANGTASLVGVC